MAEKEVLAKVVRQIAIRIWRSGDFRLEYENDEDQTIGQIKPGVLEYSHFRHRPSNNIQRDCA